MPQNKDSDDQQNKNTSKSETNRGNYNYDMTIYRRRRHKKSLKECWSNISTTYKTIALVTLTSILVIVSVFLYYAYTTTPPVTNHTQIKSKIINNLSPPNPLQPFSPKTASILHSFKSCAICSDRQMCGQIGREVFRKNGSAVDATIATMFCNGLITMESMGIGGGFIMNIYIDKEQKAYTLNAKEEAPENINMHLFNENLKSTTEGPLSIAIPGEISGYWAAHKRYGLLDWQELIEPTIKICENGFTMSKHMFNFLPNEIKTNSIYSRMILNNITGKINKIGTHIYPPKILCDTYRMIAKNGGNDFYVGELSKMILDDLKDAGSIINENDLKSYKVRWSDSIPIIINDHKIYVTPPPSNGPLIAFTLNILKGYGFTENNTKSEKSKILTYHRIIEALKYAYGKRTLLADPNILNIDELMNNLTSNEYAEELRKLIDDRKSYANYKHYGLTHFNNQDYGTSHFSILAPNGDAVSVTSSINHYFGSKIIGKRTGIIFNNGIGDFAHPNITENYYNLPITPTNLIKPRARPVSSMSPIIVCDNKTGNVSVIIGGAGGSRIPSAIILVLIRYLWFNENIKHAIDAPRFHHQTYPMVLLYEFGFLQTQISGLESLGHKTNRTNINNIVCAITKTTKGIFANADYRKNGDVIGY